MRNYIRISIISHCMKNSSQSLTRGEALKDLSQLLRIVTEAHPEPFSNCGSQIMFYEAADKLMKNLPQFLSKKHLHLLASRITALIGDGHTSMDSLSSSNERVWLEFEPIEENLVVVGVYEKKHMRLIGAKLSAINGIQLRELCSRMKMIRGTNGTYNNLVHLDQAFKEPSIMSDLLENNDYDNGGMAVSLEFYNEKSLVQEDFTFTSTCPGALLERHVLNLPESPESDLAWTILENGIGYLRIDSMRKYRENYESQISLGASETFLRELLQRSKIDSPGNIYDAISKIPSASDSILELLAEMKTRNIPDLIIDLRNNTGGNSYLTNILGYFLYGKRIMKIDEGYDVVKHSSLYMKQFSENPALELSGGYDFEEKNRWISGGRGLSPEDWNGIVGSSRTFRESLARYEPLEDIKTYVLCSARTFSAGFDLLSFLKKCGAIMIGVPPSQAANAFTHTLRFTLDISGLRGWVSSKIMMKFPTEPIFFEITPDVIVGLKSYREYGWAVDTTVMETMNIIKAAKKSENDSGSIGA